MASFKVYLIHNQEKNRLIRIRKELKGFYSFSQFQGCTEVFYQRDFKITKPALLFRAAEEIRFKILRNFYLERPVSTLRIIVRALRQFMFNFKSVKNIRRFRSICSVETIVTHKHLEVLGNFLNDDVDFAVIIESDAYLLDRQLIAGLGDLDVYSNTKPMYVNLGQGFDFGRLGVNKLNFTEEITNLSYRFLIFCKCFTNTNVAYSVNKAMARKIFDKGIRDSKRGFLLPIDWQLDKFFMEFEREGVSSKMLYVLPEPVGHGSRNSDGSWRS